MGARVPSAHPFSWETKLKQVLAGAVGCGCFALVALQLLIWIIIGYGIYWLWPQVDAPFIIKFPGAILLFIVSSGVVAKFTSISVSS